MVDNRAIVMYGPFPVGKDGTFGGMADGHVFGLCIPVVALGGHDGLSLALRAQIIPTAYVPMTMRLPGGLLEAHHTLSPCTAWRLAPRALPLLRPRRRAGSTAARAVAGRTRR